MLRRILWPCLLTLAACTTPAPPPPAPAPQPAPPPPAKPAEAPPKASTLSPEEMRRLMAASKAAQPTRPLNVRANCSFRDIKGYRGTLKLDVRQAEVKRFAAEITIPPYGVCRFALDGFEQAAKLPNVHLTAKGGGNCAVRMWEQGKRTTVAFSDCPAQCSGEAFDYLWPIFVETKTGRCS